MIHFERAEPYYPRDDRPLLAFTLPYAEMVARFGPAHRQMDDRDDEPGPCEYWSFRFPCGLTTFITYHFHAPTGPGGRVTASSPDIRHNVSHLPIVDCIFWRLDTAEPDLFRKRYGNPSDGCGYSGTQPNDNTRNIYPATHRRGDGTSTVRASFARTDARAEHRCWFSRH